MDTGLVFVRQQPGGLHGSRGDVRINVSDRTQREETELATPDDAGDLALGGGASATAGAPEPGPSHGGRLTRV